MSRTRFGRCGGWDGIRKNTELGTYKMCAGYDDLQCSERLECLVLKQRRALDLPAKAVECHCRFLSKDVDGNPVALCLTLGKSETGKSADNLAVTET